MNYLYRTLASVALALGTTLSAPSHARTIDFEDVSASIYGDGDSFSSDGFTFTTYGVLGGVDSSMAFFGLQSPSGDSTLFYYGLDDSHVVMTLDSGLAFSLTGFDAGFIGQSALVPGADSGMIVVSATQSDGQTVTLSFSFGLVGSDFASPFLTYSFASLGSLVSVDFSACSYDDSGACVNLNEFRSQFALDNLQVASVPEASTSLMLAFGLAVVATGARRRAALLKSIAA